MKPLDGDLVIAPSPSATGRAGLPAGHHDRLRKRRLLPHDGDGGQGYAIRVALADTTLSSSAVRALRSLCRWRLVRFAESEAIEALDVHLRTYAGEDELYRRVVPRIPKAVVRRWAATQPHSFRESLRANDRHVGVNPDLPFDDCETVADFLQFVFGITTDLAVHHMVVTRLLEVGVSHARWHVRDVTVRPACLVEVRLGVAVAVEGIDDHRRSVGFGE